MRSVLTVYLHYARHSWFAMGMLFVEYAATTAAPLVFGHLISMLSGELNSSHRWIWASIALIATLNLLGVCSQSFFRCIIIRETAAMARCMKEFVIQRFMQFDSETRDNISSAEWERRICADTEVVAQSIYPTINEIIGSFLSFVMVCSVMIYQQPRFLLLIAVLASGFICIFHTNKIRLRRSAQNARISNYDEGTSILDFLALAPIIGLFHAGQPLFERFSHVTRQMEIYSVKSDTNSALYTSQIRGFMYLGQAVFLLFAVIEFFKGEMEVGTIVAYMMLIGQVAGQMGQLVFVVPPLTRGIESVDALEENFGLLSGKRISSNYTPAALVPLTQTGAPLLRLRDVGFCYRNGHCRVLRGLNWEVQPGEYHSILGSNGEGKSTLIRLLLGSLSSEEGCISRNFARPGYVPQVTAIFRGSFRDNLTLCRQNVTEEHLSCVLHCCRLEQLVEKLGGLDAAVSREQLSGGEVQRIGIARALLVNPDLLVVDEITNNLDIVNKSVIFSTLRELKGHCTIISISHDMEALADSDFCWMLHRGTLTPIPEGTAEEKRAFAFHMIENNHHAD